MKKETMEHLTIIFVFSMSIFLLVFGYSMLLMGQKLFGRADTVLIWSGGMAFWLGINTLAKSIHYFWQDILKIITKIVRGCNLRKKKNMVM